MAKRITWSRWSRRLRLQLLEGRTAPATFTVTNLNNSGSGSLRTAVASANASAGEDTIGFQAGLAGEITLTSGEIVISDDVTIAGPGNQAVVILGNKSSRAFNITAERVEIYDLTLANCATSGSGGAINSAGYVRLVDCILVGNQSPVEGGSVATGSLSTTDCTFINNLSTRGGAISVKGSMTMTRCTVAGNDASIGGGVMVGYSSSIYNSTISGNTAANGYGGGIAFATSLSTDLFVSNSTVSGNSASQFGGGIAIAAIGTIANVEVEHSTVVYNVTNDGGGGGIGIYSSAVGTFKLHSTIVAQNTAYLKGRDVYSLISANCQADHNLISAIDNSNVSFVGGSNQFGTSTSPLYAMLTFLGDFGGPTKTHYPLPGSPVIDAGGVDYSSVLDQRGYDRFNYQLEIGAVEVNPMIWVVNRVNDEYDFDLSFADLSLREAIHLSNVTTALDKITFSPTVFSSSQTIGLTSGSLSVAGPVEVEGPGADVLTISGNHANTIFYLNPAPAGTPIKLSGMTLANGSTAGAGGAITASEINLSLTDCVLTGNSATLYGGAVAVGYGGSLTAFDCTFVNNTADKSGGAVWGNASAGSPTSGINLTRCTLASNTANIGGGASVADQVVIHMCTITGNSSSSHSGGVFLTPGPNNGSLLIRNSTISGNSAATVGGGVGLAFLPGTIAIQNSTITNNTALVRGGGVAAVSGNPTVALESSIVAKNVAAVHADVSTTTLAAKASAVFDSAGITTFTDLGGNLPFGTDPLLGDLRDNGGTTKTHRPLFGSPVIDKGSNPLPIMAIDQRGYGRMRGAGVDMGAYETPAPLIVTNVADSGVGSLRQAITTANATFEHDVILFDPAYFSVPRQIALLTALPAITSDVEFLGTTAANVIVTRDAAAPSFRLFDCQIADAGNVSFANMTLTGGVVASLGTGGGILAGDDNVAVTNCVLSNNSANSGGAIGVGFFGGTITIVNTTMTGNTATQGAVINFDGAGTLFMDNSTVTGNTATGFNGGGGLRLGSAVIRNSTFSGNTSSGGRGGAIVTLSGTATIQNSTITNNSANTTGGGIQRQGGTLIIESTIVAKNVAVTSGNDLQGTLTVNFSLIGVADDGPTITGANNKTGTKANPLNPLLGPLTFNGGPTETHVLLAGSPALDAGSNPALLATDQRGVGFLRSAGAAADIGAVEEQPSFVVYNANDAGVGSLRQAIAFANGNPGHDTVTFDASFFATAKTITLTTGEIAITDAVTIAGPSAQLSVSGNNTSRVFNIEAPGAGAAVAISRLRIVSGKSIGDGGGIVNFDEALTLSDCIITGNFAAVGGGVCVNGTAGSLVMERCLVVGNAGSTFGGGLSILTNTNSIIRASTIHGNASVQAAGVAFIAAGPSSSLLIESSTISGNVISGSGNGGGVFATYAYGFSAGSLVVRNSTISGNAGRFGGGIAVEAGSLLVQNSTITNNTATGTGQGGGIFHGSSAAAMTIESSIVSANVNGPAPDIRSFAPSITVNNSAIGSALGFTLAGSNNLPFGTDLKLGSLALNGGPTQTHALLSGSPAIDKGSNPALLTTDQRGGGFLRTVNGTDIGAFEVQVAATKVAAVQVNDGTAQRSQVTSLVITFDQPPSLPGNPADAFQLRRQGDGANVALSAIPSGNVVTLTFSGGPVDGLSLADGRYTLTIFASQVTNLDGNGDGTIGDNYELTGDPAIAPRLFRLFGDADGDGDVDTTDFGAFRTVFGGTSNIFDFDNDNDVDTSDFGAFRSRFGASV